MDKQIIGGVAVIEKDGKCLLIKQSKNKPLSGLWRHPGGTFEKGESDADALVRELKEEMDLDIKVLGDKPFHTEKVDYKPGYFGFYKAVIIGGTIKINEEIDDYGWFTLEEIKKLPLMKATKSFYKKEYGIDC